MRATSQDHDLPTASAASCGMDIGKLNGMLDILQEWKIKDVVIVRHGHTVWEWHHGGSDRIAPVYSCTKSILNGLFGIAIGQGYIDGLHQPLSDFLKLGPQSADSQILQIPLSHFFTMTAGLEWPDFDKPYKDMKQSADWVQFVLNQPSSHEPGEAFVYNSGGSHLLSAVLTQATGQSAAEFGRTFLFDKLGFRRVTWPSSRGVNEGGAGLSMSSRDLAKFGLLYLQNGRWKGEQLIPESWIRASTVPHHKAFLHYEPPIYGSYGYHWWISSASHNGYTDLYFALGFGGQYLFVIPEFELVAVIRKNLAGKNKAMLSKRLLFEYIMPAAL
jgi:CubicO group peptidase (beta-lactamase class C family)